MSLESQLPESPLTTFISHFSEEDKNTIEVDIFNSGAGLPIEVLQQIKDSEVARRIMGRLRQFIEWKKRGMTKIEVKAESEEILKYIESELDK